MAIDLLLCQVPHVDPTTDEYKEHVELVKTGGKYVFGTHAVFTHLSTFTLRGSSRGDENPCEH